MSRIRHTLVRTLLAGACLALAASPVLAQTGPTPARPAKPAKATKPEKPAKVKVLTIEEESIEGGVPTGQIIPVDARGYDKHTSLIRVRTSFVDRILESAENL